MILVNDTNKKTGQKVVKAIMSEKEIQTTKNGYKVVTLTDQWEIQTNGGVKLPTVWLSKVIETTTNESSEIMRKMSTETPNEPVESNEIPK